MHFSMCYDVYHMVSVFFIVFHWHLCYQSAQISQKNLSETYTHHEWSAFCNVWFQFLSVCPVSMALEQPKTFQIKFSCYHAESKNLSQGTEHKIYYEFVKIKSLKVCNMIMENLTAYTWQCNTVNTELHCGGGSDWMKSFCSLESCNFHVY